MFYHIVRVYRLNIALIVRIHMFFNENIYEDKLRSIWNGEPHEEYDIEKLINTSMAINVDVRRLSMLEDIINQHDIADIDVWRLFRYDRCILDSNQTSIMCRILVYMANYVPCVRKIPIINGRCRIYKHPKCIFAIFDTRDELTYIYVYDKVLYTQQKFYYIIADIPESHYDITANIYYNNPDIPERLIDTYVTMMLASYRKQPKSAMK